MSLYTWNVRTGYLDALATYSGLQFVGWILLPGKYLKSKSSDFWRQYVYLIDVQDQNEELQDRLERLSYALATSKEEAAEVTRLRSMLSFETPKSWASVGARVIAYRLGPQAALETIMVSKGTRNGITENTPAVNHEGVLGRVFRSGPDFSTVLLIADRNSKIAVMGQTYRTPGVLSGNGSDEPLTLMYVPLNSPLEKGELLITSGLDGIFPKGLPVARVREIQRSKISLFLTVKAELLMDIRTLEEVMLLKRSELSGGTAEKLYILQ